jgi:hypothetical protein
MRMGERTHSTQKALELLLALGIAGGLHDSQIPVLHLRGISVTLLTFTEGVPGIGNHC